MPTPIVVWPVSDLERVYARDAAPADAAARAAQGWHLHAAGGEWCSLQVGLHASPGAEERLDQFAVTVDPPRLGDAVFPADGVRVRWVDSVPVPHAVLYGGRPERPELIPGFLPDPLVAQAPMPKSIFDQPFSTA